MQALGFAYAIEPVLRKLYANRDDYESRLKIHMEYFNTQPYLASFILGASARIEQDRASGRNAAGDVIGLKNALMAPLGALGDSFFWGALKPLCAVVSVALIMTGTAWAPLLFLLLYNIWHIGLRASVLFWGFATTGDPLQLMAHYRFTVVTRRFKAVTLSVLGGILGTIVLWRQEFRPVVKAPGVLVAGAGLAMVLVLVSLLRKGGSPVKLMLGLAAVCLALAYLGVV